MNSTTNPTTTSIDNTTPRLIPITQPSGHAGGRVTGTTSGGPKIEQISTLLG